MNNSIDKSETKPFTKRIIKWGLLQRVAKPDKPWSFVNGARWIFDDELYASIAASDLMFESTPPPYMYKPVEIIISVAIPG